MSRIHSIAWDLQLQGTKVFLDHAEKMWVWSGVLVEWFWTGKLFRVQGSSGSHKVSLLWGLHFFTWYCFNLSLLLSGQSSLKLLVQWQEFCCSDWSVSVTASGSAFTDRPSHGLLASHGSPASGSGARTASVSYQLHIKPGLVLLPWAKDCGLGTSSQRGHWPSITDLWSWTVLCESSRRKCISTV